MPFLDYENLFSGTNVAGVTTGQAIALAAGIVSTNVVDQLAGRVLGAGNVPDLLIQFSGIGGAATTLRAVLYGADDAAFAVNKTVIADTGVSAVQPAGSSGLLRAACKVTKPRRFLRVEYDIAGAASTANVIAGFVTNEQTTPETIL